MKNIIKLLLIGFIAFALCTCETETGQEASLEQGKAVTPTADPPGGTYSGTQLVTLVSATDGAAIYYTTDGSIPGTGSNLYTGSIAISDTVTPTTLRAIAVKSGITNSDVLTAIYTITKSSMGQLTEVKWLEILQGIESNSSFDGKLDLSDYDRSTSTTGGGLRSDGNFDPYSIVSIGKSKITNLILPNTTIGIVDGTSDAPSFRYFTNLENFSGAMLSTIGSYAFSGCTKLSKTELPSWLTSIGEGAFQNCTSLTQITLPALLTAIGNDAFSSCTGLISVTFMGTLSSSSFADSFPGNLKTKYFEPDGGSGTYTRPNGTSEYWAKTITTLAVTNVTAPVIGAAPSTASASTGNFTRGNVAWSPAHNPFQGGQVYTASITLTANSGYTFTGLTTATINGSAAVITNNTGAAVTLTHAFPETALAPITSAAITVTAPVIGAAPSTASASTGNFTRGNVTWSPAHSPFQHSTVYTASITLTANSGYTFTGLTTATINGNAAAVSNNIGTTVMLTRQFPATLANAGEAIELVWIPSGTFTMGSPTSEYYRLDSETQRQITISKGFYMGKYEVTQEQYQAVTGLNPSNFLNNPAAGEVQRRRPVEMVTWYDAVEFCNKLSEREWLTKAYTITGRTPATGYPITSATVTINWETNGYRLPTEAEWEYACRAGTTTAYNTGNTISDNTGWYTNNSNSITHEVGKKPPNAWGLYDMHGNVWEWCWDWYGTYTGGSQTDPRGAASGSDRVERGGSWVDSGRFHRSAYRYYNYPNYRGSSIGFRLIRP